MSDEDSDKSKSFKEAESIVSFLNYEGLEWCIIHKESYIIQEGGDESNKTAERTVSFLNYEGRMVCLSVRSSCQEPNSRQVLMR